MLYELSLAEASGMRGLGAADGGGGGADDAQAAAEDAGAAGGDGDLPSY
jgi:hypothetical protein